MFVLKVRSGDGWRVLWGFRVVYTTIDVVWTSSVPRLLWRSNLQIYVDNSKGTLIFRGYLCLEHS